MKNYFKPHIVEFSYPGTSKRSDFYVRKLGFLCWLYYSDYRREWSKYSAGCDSSTTTAAIGRLNKALEDERYKKALKNPKVTVIE